MGMKLKAWITCMNGSVNPGKLNLRKAFLFLLYNSNSSSCKQIEQMAFRYGGIKNLYFHLIPHSIRLMMSQIYFPLNFEGIKILDLDSSSTINQIMK